ncbi:hypothetical protein COCOBI_13-1180 [Coccomyxa sp. Obi]|nr:hypothetical protein COCOBI_13-1180 [Coccomyxa sp. Obi]
MRQSRKANVVKYVQKDLEKKGEGAKESEPHATGATGNLRNMSGPVHPRNTSGPSDRCVEYGLGDRGSDGGTNIGEVFAGLCLTDKSVASSDTDDIPTEGAGKDDPDNISFLVEAQAKLERNIKVLETFSMLGKPAYDSGYKSHEEASVDSDDEVTELFTGEKDGYHFRVPMEVHEEGKRMSYFELLNDVCARQEQIVKDLQREKKAMAALDRWSTCWDDVDDFVPPACFFDTAELTTSE